MLFFLLVLCFSSMLLKSVHLLSFLIGLEFVGLVVFFYFTFQSYMSTGILISLLFLLGAMGCESALGLVLFVLGTRFHSKDYILNLSLLKF